MLGRDDCLAERLTASLTSFSIDLIGSSLIENDAPIHILFTALHFKSATKIGDYFTGTPQAYH